MTTPTVRIDHDGDSDAGRDAHSRALRLVASVAGEGFPAALERELSLVMTEMVVPGLDPPDAVLKSFAYLLWALATYTAGALIRISDTEERDLQDLMLALDSLIPPESP